MGIRICGITKYFGSYPALRNIELEVQSGELVALLGPSGSGKTTLLRIVAGLEGADEGMVELHGEDATAKSPRDRRVGFVFQHYAMFRHLSVFENVAFGLRVRPRKVRPSKSEIRQRVMDLLHLVQLDRYAERYPAQLSGGQRQRVALAGRSRSSPRCCFSTNLSGRWTRRCARNCAPGCGGCTMKFTSPAFSSRTIRKRRWRWRTGW